MNADDIGPTVTAYMSTLVANLERSMKTGRELEEDELSPAEIRLMEAFMRIGLDPAQQYPIGAYHADFYFVDVRLVVEVDGKQHADRWERDQRRDRTLARKGIATLRISARDVFADPDGCARAVRDRIDVRGFIQNDGISDR